MTRLIYNMSKKLLFAVAIPFFIELILLIIAANFNFEHLKLIHIMWFAVSTTILTLAVAFDNFKFYYLGEDDLLHLLPYSNELLLLIKSLMSGIVLWCYSLLGFLAINLIDKENLLHNFQFFGYQKIISVISFLTLFNLSLLVIKNIRSPKIGILVCLLINMLFIGLSIYLFKLSVNTQISNWIIGFSGNAQAYPIYLNILQIQIVSSSFQYSMPACLINILLTTLSLILFVIIKKTITINYLRLS
ncbi:MAG: hypothetical protein M3Z87_10255 [Lactobacillus sp.]|nr:hypothetical protein [Lactobacillus sp.]